jgi:multidrug efflux pump subunit AcrA (membrane-fusion protein)
VKSVFSSPWLRRSLIALAALAVAVAAVMWFGRSKPVSVVVAEVQRGKVEATIANTRAGAVETCQRAKLSTITGGRIEVLTVKEGDRVKKGQLLMKLWNEDQQAQQALAVAQLEMSRKRVGEACTLAEAAEREARRQTDLRIKGFVSTAREDAARSDADARQAACAASRADIGQAQARVNVTRVEQGRTLLVAPFDGTVARSSARSVNTRRRRRPACNAACHRSDRRLLPLPQGADGRGRRATHSHRPASAHLARRAAQADVSWPRKESRTVRIGSREASAHG